MFTAFLYPRSFIAFLAITSPFQVPFPLGKHSKSKYMQILLYFYIFVKLSLCVLRPAVKNRKDAGCLYNMYSRCYFITMRSGPHAPGREDKTYKYIIADITVNLGYSFYF